MTCNYGEGGACKTPDVCSLKGCQDVSPEWARAEELREAKNALMNIMAGNIDNGMEPSAYAKQTLDFLSTLHGQEGDAAHALQPAATEPVAEVTGWERGGGGYANKIHWLDTDQLPVGTKLYAAAPIAGAATTSEDAPSAKQEKLRALADRIDHEKLWKGAMMYRDRLTDEQRDRLDAGVMLRRYAEFFGPGRWVLIPPTGSVQFGAGSLEKVTEMAKQDQERKAMRATQQEGGNA